jgi:hypothetical protein
LIFNVFLGFQGVTDSKTNNGFKPNQRVLSLFKPVFAIARNNFHGLEIIVFGEKFTTCRWNR